MGYLKTLSKDYIMSLHKTEGDGNITEEEFEHISALFNERPEAQEGYLYLLRSDDLTWELVEIPHDTEISDEESLSILLGGAE